MANGGGVGFRVVFDRLNLHSEQGASNSFFLELAADVTKGLAHDQLRFFRRYPMISVAPMAMKMAAAVANEVRARELPPVGGRLRELFDDGVEDGGFEVGGIALEGDSDGEGVGLDVAEGEGSGEGDELGVAVGVGVDVAEGEGLGDTVGEGLGDDVVIGVGVVVGVGVGEAVGVEVGVDVGVGVTVGLGVGVAVFVGVGHGSHPFPMGCCPPSPKCSL